MAKAIWGSSTLAESNATKSVEGNVYFPPESLNHDFFRPSAHTTVCSWKGVASYYDVVVNGLTNQNAAWYYPEPKPEAAQIKGYVAFWKGVQVAD
jgi:uncharacterized protein (DUF427 family)